MKEKEILSMDGITGGNEEFVLVNRLSDGSFTYVLIVEAKRNELERIVPQCVLSMKNARDLNGKGDVFGFVTNGPVWRMLKNGGKTFTISRQFMFIFEGMTEQKEKWMENNSELVRCLWMALTRFRGAPVFQKC